jgi:hypothetical protein
VVPDGGERHDEAHARVILAEAAVERMGRMSAKWVDHQELVDRLRAEYMHRLEHLDDRHDATEDRPTTAAEQERIEHGEILLSLLEAEREALLRLRETGAVSAESFRRIERDLDLAQLRLDL